MLGRSKSGKQVPVTGDAALDLALARHGELEERVRQLVHAMNDLVLKVGEVGGKSVATADALSGFYTGVSLAGEERARLHAAAASRAAKTVTDRLLDTARQHIVAPLADYQRQLDSLRVDINALSERQSKLEHYQSKVVKLEQEKTARGGKGESAKQIDKLTRNLQKLSVARTERDQLCQALGSRLEFIQSSRVEKMDPIFRFIVLFQQEWHSQVAVELGASLPVVTPAAASPPPAVTPIAYGSPAYGQPSPPGGKVQYDAAGNRVGSPGAPPPPPPPPPPVASRSSFTSNGASHSFSSSPSGSGSPPAPGLGTAAAAAELRSRAPAQAPPPPPPPVRVGAGAAPPPIVVPRRPSTNAVAAGSPPPTAMSPPTAASDDQQLTDKWFKV
jgi:hypothetical protein